MVSLFVTHAVEIINEAVLQQLISSKDLIVRYGFLSVYRNHLTDDEDKKGYD